MRINTHRIYRYVIDFVHIQNMISFKFYFIFLEKRYNFFWFLQNTYVIELIAMWSATFKTDNVP